jgi:hydroxypyruvate isomerase
MERLLDLLAAAGYDGGEILTDWMKWSAEEKRRILRKKEELKLSFDAMFPSSLPLNHPELRAKLVDEVKAAVPAAQELGCTMFLLRSGNLIPGQSEEQKRAEITESLKAAGEISAAAGIQLLLEPIDRIESKQEAVASVTEGSELARATGNPMVKVLYDLYHEQRGGGNLIEKLQKNIDRVGLIHVADVPGRLRPGTGEIDYPNIYRALAKLPYTGYICMEFNFKADPVQELNAAKAEVLEAMATA